MTNDIDPRCQCGSTDIEHAYDGKWKCENCGRFHDAKALDRMVEKERARVQ